MRLADTSPGDGSLVGGEPSQSLWSRLLVSVLRLGDYLQSKIHLFLLLKIKLSLNRHIGFNVIFAAVYYNVILVFCDVIILLVYM